VKIKQKSILALIIAILLILLSSFLDTSTTEEMKVYFLNVGQGDSALIVTPENFKVLVDGGRGDQLIKELENILNFWDRKIDVLVISHGDIDHIGGFFGVLERYEVTTILRSYAEVDSENEKELLSFAKELGIEIKNIKQGDKIIIDKNSDIYLDTYWPKEKVNGSSVNDNSLVFELIHKENEFLFTGDVGISTEIELIDNLKNKIDSDVLKVGHHGSKNSTSRIFLETVSPIFSILSYGENSYGHPNKEVVEKLQESGGGVFHTKDRATTVARSDGNNIEVSNLPTVFPAKAGIQNFINIYLRPGFLPTQE